jgi:hypothetical protein
MPHGLAMEALEDGCEISWGLCDTTDSHLAEHAHNVCLLILHQEDGYIADNCMTRKILAEGMKYV